MGYDIDIEECPDGTRGELGSSGWGVVGYEGMLPGRLISKADKRFNGGSGEDEPLCRTPVGRERAPGGFVWLSMKWRLVGVGGLPTVPWTGMNGAPVGLWEASGAETTLLSAVFLLKSFPLLRLPKRGIHVEGDGDENISLKENEVLCLSSGVALTSALA